MTLESVMKILFGSYKGGPGKSTLATNFAYLLAKQGRDVLLVDGDKQGSATLWAAIRSRSDIAPSVTCMSAHGESINTEIDKLAPKFDDIIIDTAGHDSVELRSAMLAADILITPVEIALFSTATLADMQDLIRKGRAFNRGLKAFLVPNRLSTNKARGAAQLARIVEARDSLGDYTLTNAALKERTAYSDVTEHGMAVGEWTDAKAAQEIEAVFNEVCHGE